MEKVRVALEVLKKYHFWILLVLIVLITFGTWYMATSDRADAFSKQKTAIDGKFSSVEAIKNFRDHPSEAYNQALKIRTDGDTANTTEEAKKLADIKEATKSLAGNVSAAAERLYDDQRKTFKLPPVYPNNQAQQERFAEDFWKVWNHKIEDIETPPAEATNKEQYELDKTFRLQYRDQIKETFPDLFKRIDLRTAVDAADNAEGGSRRPSNMPTNVSRGEDPTKQYKGVLVWAGADELIKRFENWNDIPSTIQIMLAQEDLWVYEALLNVIHNTNNSAKDGDKNYVAPASHKDAPIKEIKALEIGNEAAESWAACENAVFNFSGDSSGGTATGDPRSAATAAGGPSRLGGNRQPTYLGPSTSSSGGTGGTTSSLLAGRYVDDNGKPLADPKQQPNQEFRMIPINMRVVMEQKAIPRLLVECANSNMRIDVRSVRILKETPPAFDVNASSSTGGSETPGAVVAPMPAGDPRAGGLRGRGGFVGGGMGRAQHAIGQQDPNGGNGNDEDSADPTAPPVPVEIQGIIYIYNPPSPQATNGQGTAATGAAPATPAPAAGAVPPAAPTSTPPATGTSPVTAPPGISQPK
jgi:hypothetical protein